MDSSMPNVIYYQSLKNADLENLLTQIHSTAKCATNCGETGPASAVSERLSKPLAVTPYEEPIEDCCAPLGHILPVTINEIINLNNFLLIKSADEQVYSKMEHRMKQFYEKNGHSFPMQQIKRNHFYVIKCGEKWLRAQVINQNRNFFFCWLIDYGYTEVLRSDQFYPLDRQFAHLPKRSFKASLNDVESLTGFWTKQDMAQLELLTTGRQLNALIVDKSGQYHHVSLFTKEENINQLMHQFLLAKL